jgi:hypothetical protein
MHVSDWRCWESGDSPRFEFQMVRHDMAEKHGIDIGMIDFNVRVEGCLSDPGNEGWLTCNQMRDFGQWLVDLAAEIDPHHLNGEPLSWRQEEVG